MDELLDTEAFFELWEADFEEDGRRKDMMPPDLPCPIRVYLLFLSVDL